MQEKGHRTAAGRRPQGWWSRLRTAGNRWWSTPSAAKAWWTTGLTLGLCLFMITARPVWSQIQPAGRDASWAQVLTAQPAISTRPAVAPSTAAPTAPSLAVPSPIPASGPTAPIVSTPREPLRVAAAKSEAELFGDQLQALTSLYETVITVLAVGLGLLATAAFAAIRFASMREAESLAREVLRGEEYRAHVAALIKEQVESQLKQVKFDIQELQETLGSLIEEDEDVSGTPPPVGNGPTSAAPAPVPPTPPPAVPAALAEVEASAQSKPAAAVAALPEPPAPPANAGGIEPSTQENDSTPGSTSGNGV